MNTIIFLGPSLDTQEARKHYPKAHYLPPARCGDVIKAMRLPGIERIAIIDGFFEQCASIWHKEILYAMSQGIEVLGASSMGALRAAECHRFGMIGIGRIFNDYLDGSLTDDDEVALVHDPQMASRITPLVNIRATCEQGLAENAFTNEAYQDYFNTLKSLPYYERQGFDLPNHPEMSQWCKAHYIDQKAADALALLDYLKEHAKQAPPPLSHVPTIFLDKCRIDQGYAAFSEPSPTLPKHEQHYAQLPPDQQYAVKLLCQCIHLVAPHTPLSNPNVLEVIDWAERHIKDASLPTHFIKTYFSSYYPDFKIPDWCYDAYGALLGTLWQVMTARYQFNDLFIQSVFQTMCAELSLHDTPALEQWMAQVGFEDMEMFHAYVGFNSMMALIFERYNLSAVVETFPPINSDWLKTAVECVQAASMTLGVTSRNKSTT